ncbi:MAG: hypothetical protein ABH821_06400 [archaeon]
MPALVKRKLGGLKQSHYSNAIQVRTIRTLKQKLVDSGFSELNAVNIIELLEKDNLKPISYFVFREGKKPVGVVVEIKPVKTKSGFVKFKLFHLRKRKSNK